MMNFKAIFTVLTCCLTLALGQTLYYCDASSRTCRSCQQSQCGYISQPGRQFWRSATDCTRMERQCNSAVGPAVGPRTDGGSNGIVGSTFYQCPSAGQCRSCVGNMCVPDIGKYSNMQQCQQSERACSGNQPNPISNGQQYYYCPGSGGSCVGCTRSGGSNPCPTGINLWPSQTSCDSSERRCSSGGGGGGSGGGSQFQCVSGGQCRICGGGNGACIPGSPTYSSYQQCSQQCSSGGGSGGGSQFQCVSGGQCRICGGGNGACVPGSQTYSSYQQCSQQCSSGGGSGGGSQFQCVSGGQCRICGGGNGACIPGSQTYSSYQQCSQQCSSGGGGSGGSQFECVGGGQCRICGGGNGACQSSRTYGTYQECSRQCSNGGGFSRQQFQCPTRGVCSSCSGQCVPDIAAFDSMQECLASQSCRAGGGFDGGGIQNQFYQCPTKGRCTPCTGSTCASDIPRFSGLQQCLSAYQCQGNGGGGGGSGTQGYQCLQQGRCSYCSGSNCVPDIAVHNTAQECQRACAQNNGGSGGTRTLSYCDRNRRTCVSCTTGTGGTGSCPPNTNLWQTTGQCQQSETACRGGGGGGSSNVARYQCVSGSPYCTPCFGSQCNPGVQSYSTNAECVRNTRCTVGRRLLRDEVRVPADSTNGYQCLGLDGACTECPNGNCASDARRFSSLSECEEKCRSEAVVNPPLPYSPVARSGNASKCELEVRNASPADGSQAPVGSFVPICEPNGDYARLQCHGSTGFCWCVRKSTGELVPGTTKSASDRPPDCDAAVGTILWSCHFDDSEKQKCQPCDSAVRVDCVNSEVGSFESREECVRYTNCES